MDFGKNFYWGVATAAYQIEGGREDGKGDSVWDSFTRKQGAIARGENGDVACDHYHRWKEDVDLIAGLNANAYRFSLAWTRLFPEGTGKLNRKGADFYSRLVDALLEKGITPFMTLYHWDMPQALQEKGGFLNPAVADWFGEYAHAVAKLYGDRVRNFMTINEPQCVLGCGYRMGVHAPGLQYGMREQLLALHNLLRAHGTAARVLKGIKGAEVGYASCGFTYAPATESEADINAAYERTFAFEKENPLGVISTFSDPVFFGKYPDAYYELEDIPAAAADDMALISSPVDFFALNIYEGRTVRRAEDGSIEQLAAPVGSPKTLMDWEITPVNMRWAPRHLYRRYGKKVYITENGISCQDYVFSDGKVHDSYRIEYLNSYLRELRAAAEDGVTKPAGYFHWSLMDNFEWAEGYKQRFGLVHVDFATQKRTPKDSYFTYRDIIRSNGGDL